MQNGNNDKKTSRLVTSVILVVLIGVTGAVFFYFQRASSRAVQNQPIVKSPPARTVMDPKLAAEIAAKIAALEQKLDDLQRTRVEIMAQFFKAQKEQRQAKTRADLLKDLQDAQQALDEAISNNPEIAATKQEMSRLLKDTVEIGKQQAVVLEAFHASQKAYDESVRTNENVIWRQCLKERKEVLGDRKDWSKMTPEENEKAMAIQKKYAKISDDVIKEWSTHGFKPLSPEDQKRVDDFKGFGQKQQDNNDKYAKLYNAMPAERARVMESDPKVAALALVVVEKQARLTASVDAAPEIAGYKNKLQDVARQMLETSQLLGQLKRQAASTSSATGAFPTQPGKNG